MLLTCKVEAHETHEMTQEELEEEAYYDSLEMLASCVEAEAGNQSFYGKQLVCDVILNRVESDDFPNTIEEVIYQPGQFAVARNGAMDRVDISDSTYLAVKTQLVNRKNRVVLYFTNGGDWNYEFREGDHYFR